MLEAQRWPDFPYANIKVQEYKVWSMAVLHGGICFTRKSNCLDKPVCSLKTRVPKILVWTLRPFTMIQFQTEGCKSSSSQFYAFFSSWLTVLLRHSELGRHLKLLPSDVCCLWHAVTASRRAQRLLCLASCVVHMCESKSHPYLGTPNL